MFPAAFLSLAQAQQSQAGAVYGRLLARVEAQAVTVTVQLRGERRGRDVGTSTLQVSYAPDLLRYVSGTFAAYDGLRPAESSASVHYASSIRAWVPGQVSISIDLDSNAQGQGEVLPDTFTDVAVLEFERTTPALALPGWQVHEVYTGQGASFDAGAFTTQEVALPVELVAFSAHTDASHVILSWETAGETNNAGFAIEYAHLDTDENQESGEMDVAWRDVGFVEGAGTTEQIHRYTYRTSTLVPGLYAFRLRQVDFDGTTTHSATVEIPIENQAFAFRVYPSPASGTATVEVEVPDAHEPVEVEMLDLLGRQVFARTFWPEGSTLRVFTPSNLSSGFYLVRVHYRGTICVQGHHIVG